MTNRNEKNHKPGDGSTGPKSPEGKEVSARNATRHGGCSASHFILPTEKQEDFDELLNYWVEHYGSNNPQDDKFIQHMVEREWQFRRCERLLDQAWFQLLSETPNPMDWSPEQHRILALLRRYRNAAERDFQTAFKNMEAFRRNRMNEVRLIEQTKGIYYLNRQRGFVDNAGPLFEDPPPRPNSKDSEQQRR